MLVHTSTLAVKMGGQKLMEHTESLTPHISEDALILGDYARGRVRAEELVLEAHDGPTQTGNWRVVSCPHVCTHAVDRKSRA